MTVGQKEHKDNTPKGGADRGASHGCGLKPRAWTTLPVAMLCAVLLLSCTVLLPSCTGHDAGADTPPQPAPVSFSSAAQTRAGASYVSGTSFAAGAQIGVFGYYTEQSPFGDGTAHSPNFMYDQPVVLQEDGAWTYSPVKYWPNNEDEHLTFYAYYPYGGAGITPTFGGGPVRGLPSFDVQVQTLTHQEVDFMLSDIRADETHATAGTLTPTDHTVRFTFRHALAQVVVKVVDETNTPLEFHASLTGLCDRGTCYSTTAERVNWSNITRSAPGVTFRCEEEKSDTERIFLMIPQPLRGTGIDPRLHINYEYHGGLYHTAPVLLNDIDDVTQWKPATTYTYTYHITHTGYDISVSVNPWYQSGMVFNR